MILEVFNASQCFTDPQILKRIQSGGSNPLLEVVFLVFGKLSSPSLPLIYAAQHALAMVPTLRLRKATTTTC